MAQLGMLAYRHAFHAGNHADVLKHTVLALVLEHMNQKDKGWRYVDTHAGAGGYSLQGEYALKRGEFEQGIARLLDHKDLPQPLAALVAIVRAFNGGKAIVQYPGSPAIAHALMRQQDQLRLFEMHPTDHKILASYLGDVPGVPGQLQHDEIKAVRRRIAEVARRHGKIAATVCGRDQIKDYADMGYNLLSVGADVVALVQYADASMEAFDKQLGTA